MKRRDFVFSSLKAAALLSPVLSIRRAEAQGAPPPPFRVFFWVSCQGYPNPDDFFPQGGESDFRNDPAMLSPMLASFANLRDQLVVVDGVDIAETGYDNGNNHVRTMGKVLTAHDIVESPNEEDGALPGGISIDQFLAQELGWSTLEMLAEDRDRGGMRERPFALGPLAFKTPMLNPSETWDKAFGAFNPDLSEDERQQLLRRRRSVLDGMSRDLSRLRQELVGVERLKLDTHEAAIRSTEQRVQQDIENAAAQCTVPGATYPAMHDYEGKCLGHLDVLYSAFACNRAQGATFCWGTSGYHWPYQWVPGMNVVDTIHDEVHHRDVERREEFRLAASWDWQQVANFAQRLKDTPEGTGTMLDNTLIVALSHFGHHHSGYRLPIALIGGAQGRLQGGRYVKLPQSVDNSQLLTSVAHLCGHPITGFGDFPSCGVIPEIHGD